VWLLVLWIDRNDDLMGYVGTSLRCVGWWEGENTPSPPFASLPLHMGTL